MHARVNFHIGNYWKLPRLISLLAFSHRCFSVRFHRTFNFGEFVHKVAVLLWFTAESWHILAIFNNISRFIFVFITAVHWLLFNLNFRNVWVRTWISQRISIRGVRIARRLIRLKLSRFLLVAKMRIILAMRRCVILLFYLLNSLVCPHVAGFASGIVWLGLWFILIICSHCDAWYLIEAVFSFHFNNKNIMLL